MSAAEAPKSEQIQANVAAALSRLRGELGAASSPVAGTARNIVPKTPSDAVEPTLSPVNFTVTPLNPATLGPLPAGPVRPIDMQHTATVVRPFEPTIAAAMNPQPEAHNEDTPPAAPEIMLDAGRREPSFSMEHAARPEPDLQPDLLSGMEVPPAPPPPLAAFDTEDEVSGRGKRMRNRLLVVLVLALIVGAGAWGYILKHHAAGPVPVISADSTPEKVKPTDEGGMQVPNQNVQILDNMNGQSTAQSQDKVLPAPEQPLAPPTADTSNSSATQADAGAAASNTTSTSASANAPTVTEQSAAPIVPAPAIPNASTPAPSVAAAAPATTQSTDTQPSGTDSSGKLTLAQPQTQQAAPQPSAATTAPAPSAETPQLAAASPTTTQTAEAPSAPAPTPTLSTGSARVQLAAVKSVALAKVQWAKMQKAYPDLLGALTLNVEKVERSGGTLYRVQAGPLTDKAAAKELCGKLAAQKQACLVPK